MTLYLTETGKSLILQTLSSPEDAEILFNGVALGNGDQSDDGDAVTELGNPLNTMTITGMTTDDSFVNITAFLSNSYVLVGYHVTELGLMVRDPEYHNEQLLFAYSHVDEDEAMFLPAAGDYSLETTITLRVYVGDVEDVGAVISDSLVYATKAAFDAHAANVSNPHEVTKAQVGLGNVPNVTTNGQTPTYLEADSPAVLLSGETLGVAFSKIAAAVRSVINHIADVSNPHKVTYLQVGAAKSTHQHSTADITSGILGLARGGTGGGTAAAARQNLGIFETVYPVGSIYLSTVETSPATLFGGTWEQIKDRFLLAAGDSYSAGDVGGEAEHTLTTSEMPAHTHKSSPAVWHSVCGTGHYGLTYGSGMNTASDQISTTSAGGGAAHNNMPPYLAIYAWKRTA